MLRNYQIEILDKLRRTWKRKRSVMVQMPTGTGKTHVMADVVREYAENGVLIVAHRRELIEQISRTVTSFGVEHGLIVSGKPIDATKKVQVASIQTLTRRISCGGTQNYTEESYTGLTDATVSFPSLVIVDEAHHALAATYRVMWERWPKAKFLGLTATPCRLSGEPFTDLFDVLLQSWPLEKFIDEGWLSDFEYVSATPNNLIARKVRKLKKRTAGDYQEKEMAMVLDVPENIGHLYKTYRQYANGKRGIVFAINRAHARHIADFYQEQGVSCAVVDCMTPAKERADIVDAYRSLRIDVLLSAEVFGEGFDVPEVEFIQLARPTLSLSKYLQQVGRGMRVSEGKPHVVILDNVGLYQIFGLPTEERDWQGAFLGRSARKGHNERIVLADGGENHMEKGLENLEMVRIKKGGKKGAGLEVSLQGALYGVMYNGKVTCPAKYKEMVRIDRESQFYALAVFTDIQERQWRRTQRPVKVVSDLFTVISKRGEYGAEVPQYDISH